MQKHVNVFTDGSCLGNPGPGGYGALLIYKEHKKELSGGFKLTTNNRMELLAPIEALKSLKEPCKVTITTDSQYVRQGITSWIHNWIKNNWKTASKQPVKNVDLWKALHEEVKRHDVEWKWVKGHSGHAENELVDDLARDAASSPNLADDKGFNP